MVDGLTGVVAEIQAGGYHNCILLESNIPRCWGRDGDGQLGTGIPAHSALPLALSEPEPAAIHLNYTNGLAGSYFTLTGSGLPYSSTVSLAINGFIIPTDPGKFVRRVYYIPRHLRNHRWGLSAPGE
ncbi:MAG: RCC1 domain-containing protein [Caldilineaceae bacterium]